ncbi:MAG: flagellar protein FlaG [Burkholderiaceae bacterium]|jgi:flagellar protein FlaG|nr:flagellar protein FlaG [Burkholderiaceae bacterium]
MTVNAIATQTTTTTGAGASDTGRGRTGAVTPQADRSKQAPVTTVGRAASAPDTAALAAAREAANRQLAETGRQLTFEFDDAAGRVVTKLIDIQTQEVIRQIPSKEMLEIARALANGLQAGALVADKA